MIKKFFRRAPNKLALTVFVNDLEVKTNSLNVSYDWVVAQLRLNSTVEWSIVFYWTDGIVCRAGILSRGQQVRVDQNMRFDVARAGDP